MMSGNALDGLQTSRTVERVDEIQWPFAIGDRKLLCVVQEGCSAAEHAIRERGSLVTFLVVLERAMVSSADLVLAQKEGSMVGGDVGLIASTTRPTG